MRGIQEVQLAKLALWWNEEVKVKDEVEEEDKEKIFIDKKKTGEQPITRSRSNDTNVEH